MRENDDSFGRGFNRIRVFAFPVCQLIILET